jgi:hypothetical protein
MNLKLKAIRDRGVLSNERVAINVLHDDDIGNYMICSVETTDDNQLTNIIKRTWWFPDKEVKAGDLVVLYTKKGVDKERVHKTGSTTHFFYWGLPEPIWSHSDSSTVLIESGGWSTLTFSGLPTDAETPPT